MRRHDQVNIEAVETASSPPGDCNVPTDGEWPGMLQAANAIARARREGRSLVALRAAGSRPPLFLVHGRGEVVGFARYLRHLDPDQPFYALQPRGLSADEPPDAHVTDMARRYIKEIQGIQPDGPYYLGGYCVGGVIAYEMAQQLVEEGASVGALVMLDSPNPRIARQRSRLLHCAFELRRYARRGPRAFAIFVSEGACRATVRTVMGLLRKPYRLLGRPLPTLLRYRSVRGAMYDASDYRPRPYAGNVVLLRGVEQQGRLFGSPDLGWSDLVTGGLQICDLPAAHFDFMRAEADAVGMRLAEVLRDAQSSPSR